jgi:hypothetical protein
MVPLPPLGKAKDYAFLLVQAERRGEGIPVGRSLAFDKAKNGTAYAVPLNNYNITLSSAKNPLKYLA